MKIRFSHIAAAVLLVSCTEISQDENALPIRLTAYTVSEDMIETRSAITASPYTQSSPNELNPIDADVWFSTVSGTYTGSGTADDLDVHTSINYTSGAYTFPEEVGGKQLKYPTNSVPAYCVGFFPKSKWTASQDGTTVTSGANLVDGQTDILFAPQISGTSANPFPPQQFNHILTWIKVRVRVSSSDAPITWGRLQKVDILTKDQASIVLGTGAVSFSNSGAADKEITAYESAGLDIPTMSTEIGSVFIASTSGTAECPATVTFRITTEEWGGDKDKTTNKQPKTVTVNLLDNNQSYEIPSTAGKLYVVTLSFDALKTIDASATLTPWVEEHSTLIGSESQNTNNQ